MEEQSEAALLIKILYIFNYLLSFQATILWVDYFLSNTNALFPFIFTMLTDLQ